MFQFKIFIGIQACFLVKSAALVDLPIFRLMKFGGIRVRAVKEKFPENWQMQSAGRFTRDGGCEICLTNEFGRKSFWTAMVPCLPPSAGWMALNDGGPEPTKFNNFEDAIRAVEDYLAIFEQFIAEDRIDSIDIASGELGVAGASSVG